MINIKELPASLSKVNFMLYQLNRIIMSLPILCLGALDLAIANEDNGPCDVEIEGVTVHMSAEEAKTVWAARGLTDISVKTRVGWNIAFTSAADGTPDSIGEFGVRYTETSQGVQIRAQYQGPGGKAAEKYETRKNEFCTPEQMGKKSRTWTCFHHLIARDAEDRRQFPNCRYSLGATTRVVSESVSLRNKNTARGDEVTTPTGKKIYMKKVPLSP